MEQKTEVDGIYKVSNGVLLNKDNQALMAYKAQKKRNNLVNVLERKVNELEQKILVLENEINKIHKRLDDK